MCPPTHASTLFDWLLQSDNIGFIQNKITDRGL